MFKLEIKRSDNTIYWVEFFNSLEEANVWLSEEIKRPYWDESFSSTITDETKKIVLELTEEEAKEKIYKDRFKFSEKLKIKIAIINESKNMNVTQTQAYLSDPVIQQINALISDISFVSAKALIDESDLSSYYTNEEVTELSSMIGDYLVEEV